MEDEDEESLQCVEEGEDVGEDEGVVDIVQVQDAKHPRQSQQDHQHHRPLHPRPASSGQSCIRYADSD